MTSRTAPSRWHLASSASGTRAALLATEYGTWAETSSTRIVPRAWATTASLPSDSWVWPVTLIRVPYLAASVATSAAPSRYLASSRLALPPGRYRWPKRGPRPPPPLASAEEEAAAASTLWNMCV